MNQPFYLDRIKLLGAWWEPELEERKNEVRPNGGKTTGRGPPKIKHKRRTPLKIRKAEHKHRRVHSLQTLSNNSIHKTGRRTKPWRNRDEPSSEQRESIIERQADIRRGNRNLDS